MRLHHKCIRYKKFLDVSVVDTAMLMSGLVLYRGTFRGALDKPDMMA